MQVSIVVVAILTSLLVEINCQTKQDVSEGLQCQKDKSGKVIACSGNNTIYNDSVKKINTFIANNQDDFKQKVELSTRSRGGGVGSGPASGGSSGGFNVPQTCPGGRCGTSLSQFYPPTLLFNSYGDARFVLQHTTFPQFVQLTICDAEGSYCHGGTCQQKFVSYTLLVWDPLYPEGGLLVETFNLPSTCCCSH